jgi:hypothetical protein
VVNVYYDRNEYTLTFQDHQYNVVTNNNGIQYGLIDGQYVELTRWNGDRRYNYQKYT